MIQRFLACLLLTALIISPGIIAAQDEDEVPSGVTVHIVQRGENLFRIALSYGLTTQELADYNGIANPASIEVGQRLLIPIGASAPPIEPQTHTVQAGETLRTIAEVYGVSIEQIIENNDITNANTIYIGQVLIIHPGSEPVTQPISPAADSSTTQPFIHIVQSGETLFRIALNYGLTVNDLVVANSIADPTSIYVGQQIVIPGLTPPPLVTDLPASVSSIDLYPLILVEGQAARVRLQLTGTGAITGTFLNRALPFIAENSSTLFTAYLGVPLTTPGGIYRMEINIIQGSTTESIDLNVQVVGGNYGVQNISLPEGSDQSLLDYSVDENELNILTNLTTTITPERYFIGPMGLPAAAAMNGPFGTRRSYNNGAVDRFHHGADFAGVPGTPILAAAPGRVVLADSLAIRGVTTVIDHGWGIYTLYAHQSERYVSIGEFVTAGQAIGTIGATGRVTGAHLHWEVWINGVPVNPIDWVQSTFP